MASSRVRIVVMAAILGLVAGVGIFWLISAATGGGDEGKPVGQEATIDPSEGAGSSAGESGDPNGSGAQSPGGGGGSVAGGSQNNGRRGLHVNGVRLDGNALGDGCVTLINKTSTVTVIESVSFTVTGGAGPAAARVDAAHCYGPGDELDPPCTGITLRPSGQCVAGAVLTGRPAPGDYTLQAHVQYRYSCVSVEDSPCDEVSDWQGLSPTADKPVQISGTTSNNVPSVGFFVKGRSPVEGSSPSDETSQEPPPDESPENVPDNSDASPEAG